MGAIVAVFAAGLVVLLPSKQWVWRALVILQTVNPLPSQIPLPAAPLFSSATIIRTFKHVSVLARSMIPISVVALLAMYSISTLWSPSLREAGYFSLSLVSLLAAILFAYSLHIDGHRPLQMVLYAAAPIMLIQSLSTAIFRFAPDLELAYFNSPLLGLLHGTDIARSFFSDPNNVLDPGKSGGIFFVNGNRASMVMAAFALCYFAERTYSRSKIPLVMAWVCGVGVVATGSKTALVLTAVLGPTALILPNLLNKRRSPIHSLLAWTSLFIAATTLWILSSRITDLIVGIDHAASSRTRIFNAAADYFARDPVLGLGFGGWSLNWEDDARSYGSRQGLPPHNFFIFEWANAGIAAAAIVALICACMIIVYAKIIRRTTDMREARAYTFQLVAVLWIFAHGMYDNTYFYGTANTIPLFACLIAQIVILNPKGNRPITQLDHNVANVDYR